MNAIDIISPYKHHGMWVFDDARVGLVQEPFVSGANTWIDRVVADIPDAENGFTLIFSSALFPGHQYQLDWRRPESGGNCAFDRVLPSRWVMSGDARLAYFYHTFGMAFPRRCRSALVHIKINSANDGTKTAIAFCVQPIMEPSSS